VRCWDELPPWPETVSVLGELARRVPLGIATNCSIELGRRAAACCQVAFAVVVTAEEAGFYKPRPQPYQMALGQLGTAPARTLFVAGSAADVSGAKVVGMPVYWHNRIGLAAVGDASPDYTERSLTPLLEIV
jgi:2-haloalkanoic acid dehalogenase type II